MADLVKKRGTVKGKLTTFKTYINKIKDCKDLTELKLTELQLRLTKCEKIYDDYDILQSEIEASCDNSAEALQDREEFEASYYSTIASARVLIDSCRRPSWQDHEAGSNADSSKANTHNFVRLPKIDLPHFSGDYRDWLEFRDTYLSIIHENSDLNAINKFHYLRAALKGSAALLIQSLDFRAENYAVAWQLLSERYDNPRLLVNNHVQALFNVESIQKESSLSLRTLVDVTNKNLRALATLGQPTDHWDTLVIYMMSSKLDSVTHREWEELRNSHNDPPILTTFMKFLTNRADLLESLEESKQNKGKNEASPSSKSKSFVASADNENKEKHYYCPLCHQDHLLYTCATFRNLPVEVRLVKAKELKVCYNCLRVGHTESRCRLTGCKYCKAKHNTLLHVDKPLEPLETPTAHETIALSAKSDDNRCTNSNHSHVLLSTALVRVIDGEGKSIAARVLLDNGSTANFVTKDLCGKLNLHTFVVSSKVTGINSQSCSSSQACSLTLESYYGDYRTNIDCYVLPNITSSLPSTYININDIDIPTGICLADPSFHIPSTIDILVGAETFWKVIGANRISLGKNKPTLFETKLGWLVSGSIPKSTPHSPVCMFACESSIEQTDLTRFWELDSIPSKHHLSSEERICEQLFTETTTRNDDGRFVVTLPLKESPAALGASYQIAKRRFMSLERRLERDSVLKKRYSEFLDEYLTLGHMSKNTDLFVSDQINCFLPHHGVIRESSTTTKLRVVFDASAATSTGKSFNDIQRVGKAVQDDLLSILLRFRQHLYVVSADVEKMYRCIEITQPQRSLQQILWRSDPSLPIKSYTLNTVTYGTASAPFLATRCLTQLGYDSTRNDVQHSICHDFYVDDYLSGRDSIDETVALCKGVTETLKSAQFNLRKWHSNSSEILNSVCKSNDHSDFVILSANESSKVLGLSWQCSSDNLNFSICISLPTQINKRVILSTIAQVFDPLGLVSPCIVEAKILMQQLWRLKCSWDEEVPQNIQAAWSEFSKTLPYLNDITIPRCIKNGTPIDVTLHIFTDASEKAYGACTYVRCQYYDGSVSVRLLVAKSKVAPIKSTTIPRLELCGALMGSRLHAKVLSSLTLNLGRSVCWSDSTIVLGWLSSSPDQLKSFVRHRVNEIQEETASCEWRYVPSKENPADLVSRGLGANLLSTCSLWWSGPPFLQEDRSQWPNFPNRNSLKTLPETIASQAVFTTDTFKSNEISNLTNKISDFPKLFRIIAWINRFAQNCRKSKCDRIISDLSVHELSNSKNLLLRQAQIESFPLEYNLITSGKPLPSKNRLLPLSPFIDSDNLLRVGGRLTNAFNYDFNVKHPVLLCGKHRLSELIFCYYHQNQLHAGPQLLLSTVRHNYWPLGGTKLAKRIVRSCVKCCRLKAKTIQPIMGNLPKERVELEFPFLETGVDYAGPVSIADRKGRGCKIIKSYICIFVCLATKAMHLELVSDLTKEGFIATLNRFISRRGKPKNIFSDNGGAFVGASKELASYTAEKGINFSFIPAYTPHFGGLWESAVRSVKHHLRRVMGLTHLTYEELSTLLTQVEAVLNSRPITPLSDDPTDLYALTPAHFLIGRSLSSVPHPQVTSARITSLQRFQRIELLKQQFWNRFSNEYIHYLQKKTKWRQSCGDLEEGAMVVIKDKALPPLMWLLGRVVRVLPGGDGVARVADVRTKRGVIRRAFNNLCPLPKFS